MPPVIPTDSAEASKSAPPTVSDQLSKAAKLLKGIIALLGVLLPTVVVTTLINIPEKLGELVKLITFPASVVAVVAILLLGASIRRWSPRKSIVVFALMAFLGSVTATAVFAFGPQLVFSCRGERLVAPLTPSERTRTIIEPHDDNYCKALRRSPVSDELRRLLSWEGILTIVVLVLLMVLTVLFLVGAMVGSALKVVVGAEAGVDAAGSSGNGNA